MSYSTRIFIRSASTSFPFSWKNFTCSSISCLIFGIVASMIHFSVTKCLAGKITTSCNSVRTVCVRCSVRVIRSRVSQKNSSRTISSLELGHISRISHFTRNIPGFQSAVDRVNCTMTSSWIIFSII